jgi:membrane-associated phospholipid phosphatase
VTTPTSSGWNQRLSSPLHATDRLLIAFWGILSLVSLVLHSRISSWRFIIAANILTALTAWILAYISQRSGSKALRWVHDWAAFPFVIFTYEQLYYIIRPIHNWKDYDRLLIALDRGLLRGDPTHWLALVATPFLTEVLQIAYSLFYVLFLAVGAELYMDPNLSRFRYFRFTIVYGFLISYVGYFFLPAAGPRFTLHSLSKIDAELPGLLLTPALRWFINIFESIHPGMSDSVALASAQRDVFPSGHTMMTLVAIAIACRYKLKVRGWVLFVGMLLIVATVYLRYHYAVDVLAGAILAIPCLLTSNKAYAAFRGNARG